MKSLYEMSVELLSEDMWICVDTVICNLLLARFPQHKETK